MHLRPFTLREFISLVFPPSLLQAWTWRLGSRRDLDHKRLEFGTLMRGAADRKNNPKIEGGRQRRTERKAEDPKEKPDDPRLKPFETADVRIRNKGSHIMLSTCSKRSDFIAPKSHCTHCKSIQICTLPFVMRPRRSRFSSASLQLFASFLLVSSSLACLRENISVSDTCTHCTHGQTGPNGLKLAFCCLGLFDKDCTSGMIP